jgi:predicted amidophosphoribosyltransferase
MGTVTRQSVRCSACGQTLALDHQGGCRSCGDTNKTHEIHISGTIRLSSSRSWRRTREWYERHPVLLPVVIGITVASPFLGLLLAGWIGVAVGLGIGVGTFLLGLRAVTKVREVREGGW